MTRGIGGRITIGALIVVCSSVACRSPVGVASAPSDRMQPGPPPDHEAAADAPSATSTDEQPDPPVTAVPVDLEVLAPRVYAAVNAGSIDEVRALLDGRSSTCFGPPTLLRRRGGGFLLHGGRIVLRLDAHGVIESHVVEPGCVDHADEQVTVTDGPSPTAGAAGQDDSTRTYLLRGALAEPVSLTGANASVQSSSEWVLVATARGDYVAWARGAATVLRHTAADDTDEDPALYPPRVAGRYLVTTSPSTISLDRPDGAHVAVKGCKGALLAAASIPGGVALQVAETADHLATRVCLVDDRGVTRRVTELGVATCGLAERQPCAWNLVAASSRLVVFSGMRGGVVTLDARTGAKLPYRDSLPSQFPPEYSSCGDAVCVESTPSDDRTEVGHLERTRAGVRYRAGFSAAETTAAKVKAFWCTDSDLLVPCTL